MGIKRHKPEEIVTKLRQVEVLCGQGMPRIDAIKQVQITEQTFYRWRKQYGGMGTDQLKELKRLQKENERLRRAVSDLTLGKLILSEAARGNYGARHVAGLVSIIFAVRCGCPNGAFAVFWVSIGLRRDGCLSDVRTKTAWFRTWSSWRANMVDMGIAGLRLC